MHTPNNSDLPHEFADKFSGPFARFIKVEAIAGMLLLIAALVALAAANSSWSESYLLFWETPLGFHFGEYDFTRSLRHWINDGLMTFFFFIISLELKRALVLGDLRSPRIAALPLIAALGGIVVPSLFYTLFMIGLEGVEGWGTVMATDTAFAIGCLALFGHRIPKSLRLFLISLAIFDDVGAILVLAIGYGGPLNMPILMLAALGIAGIWGVAQLGIRAIPFYFISGAMLWLCFDASGIHTSIAGVLLGLITPAHAWVNDARLRLILKRVLNYPDGEHWSGDTTDRYDLQQAGRAIKESLSPVERLEMKLHPWVGLIILPIFALANAGVKVSAENLLQPVSIAIMLGLVLGKPLGVISFSWLAVKLGVAMKPTALTWPFIIAAGLLTGIGFTMSIFIADLAYSPSMLVIAKNGILVSSALAAAMGVTALLWCVRRNPDTLKT